MSYGYDDYGPPEPPPGDPTRGRGRRRAAGGESGVGEPGAEQAYDPAARFPEQARYPRDEQYDPYPRSEQYDPQWAQSGLGWEQQEWQQAQLGTATPNFLDYPSQHPSQPSPQPVEDQSYPGSYYRDPAYDAPSYPGQFPPYPAEDYPEQYPAPEARPEVDYGPDTGYVSDDGYTPDPDYGPDTDYGPEYDPALAPALTKSADLAPRSASADSAVSTAPSGSGAFGAAGLAVVFAIAAIAAVPVLAIVVGLSQLGVAVGWMRTAGFPAARRTMALVALTGIAATGLTYRVSPDSAPGAAAGVLGAGFVVLIADQLLRRRSAQPHYQPHQALGAAVCAALFCVLPVGYLAAARLSAPVTAACALGAAAAVLCSALLGGRSVGFGLIAGTLAGTAVGGLTAISLSAASGASGGAVGGCSAAVLALVGVSVTDRLAREGCDVRIAAQAIPPVFAASAALLVPALLRI
jgi:hypothetical protein